MSERFQTPKLARLSARQWPPKPHKFPATFKLGDEAVGILKNIDVNLIDFYDSAVKNSLEKKEQGQFHWVCDNVKTFDLSFYVPTNVLNFPDQKIDNILIMLNGLNEIQHIHYSNYDRIGSSLAKKNIGCVLYPTPFHLNRTSYLEERFKEEYEKYSPPKPPPKQQIWEQTMGGPIMNRVPHKSMLRHPEAIFCCFQQISSELKDFAKFLRNPTNFSGENVNIDSLDKTFYARFIDHKNLKINLLGYSLGGLQALYTFLKDPDLFAHCILVNSGASVDTLKTKPVGINDDDWEKIKQNCHGVRVNLPSYIQGDDRKFLTEVFFERPFKNSKIIDTFRDNISKFLFIAGGADMVSPSEYLLQFLKASDIPDTMSEQNIGMNILQVGGLSHFLHRDLDYDRWFPTIINTIDAFIRSHDPTLKKITYSDVIDYFLKLKIENQTWEGWCRDNKLLDAEGDHNLCVPEIIKKIKSQNEKNKFSEYYFVSKRYFENDSEFLRTLERKRPSSGL